jgi:hypothetical protein
MFSFSLVGILDFISAHVGMSLGRSQPSILVVFGGTIQPGRNPVFTAFSFLLAF